MLVHVNKTICPVIYFFNLTILTQYYSAAILKVDKDRIGHDRVKDT